MGIWGLESLGFRVHVPNNEVLGIWVILITIQFWGKSMTIGHLDPWGSPYMPYKP